jgi:hypothetical protein
MNSIDATKNPVAIAAQLTRTRPVDINPKVPVEPTPGRPVDKNPGRPVDSAPGKGLDIKA